MKKELSFLETLVYYLSVFFTFGTTFILKVVIKKAIIDSTKSA